VRPSRRASTPAPLERTTSGFVGRDHELTRILAQVEREPVFVICGVAGIGKTELAIRAAEELAARPGWREARRATLTVRDGSTLAEVVALARSALGPGRGPAAGALAEELAALAAALCAQPTVLRMDDLHLLTDGDAALLLGHLTRFVRGSCVLVTSRRALPVPPPAPPPWVVRVGPLDLAESRQLCARLAEALELGPAAQDEVVAVAGGNPFYVRQAAAARAQGRGLDDDPLAGSLAELTADERAVLGGLAAATVPLPRAAIVEDAAVDALIRRYLIEDGADGLATHDLVRTRARATASTAAWDEARRWAANAHLRALAAAPDDARHALEVIRQRAALGEVGGALAAVSAHLRLLARRGLDHLLLEPLATLGGGGAEVAIDLIRAHIHLRRSHVGQARAILALHAARPEARGFAPLHGLVATAAIQAGDLPAAERALATALAAPIDPRLRRRLILGQADLCALRGEHARAAALLAEAASADLDSDDARARWRRSRLIGLLFAARYAEAAEAAAAYRAEVRGAPTDLDVQLAMLEVVALAELGDGAAAQAVVDAVIAPAARAGALRELAARCYAGLAAWATGRLAVAERELRAVERELREHGDVMFAGAVGYFLGRVALDAGDGATAEVWLRAATVEATAIGVGLAPMGWGYVAAAVAAQGDLARAAAILDELDGASLPGAAATAVARVTARVAWARGDRTGMARAVAAAGVEPTVELAVLAAASDDGAAAIERHRRAASAALAHHTARGAGRGEAWAGLAMAVAHLRTGGRGDRVTAGAALARARAQLEAGPYRDLLGLAVVLEAALAPTRAASDEVLARALVGGRLDPVGQALVAAALDGGGAIARPDHAALLAAIGLRAAPPARTELIVDLARGTIATPAGAAIRGRVILAALLARLAEAEGRPVGPAPLYRAVWQSRDYHPLRHRNTLYAGVNRLRRALATLVPEGGPLITTEPEGWCLRTEAVAARIVRTRGP
jgi:hypothetical protein